MKPAIRNLMECLKPQCYDTIGNAAKKVPDYHNKTDQYGALTYALNISTSLKQCCNIALMTIIKSCSSVPANNTASDVKTLIQLIQKNWRFNVSSQGYSVLNLKKWNKITTVPLASDLKILKNHLCGKD